MMKDSWSFFLCILSYLGYNQKANKMYKRSLTEFFFSSLDRMIDTDGETGNAFELNKENTVSKK